MRDSKAQRWNRPLWLMAVVFALAAVACGPSIPEQMSPVAIVGDAGADHPLSVSDRGQLYLAHDGVSRGDIIVSSIDVKGAPLVTGAFLALTDGPQARVAAISTTPSLDVSGTETYQRIGQLPENHTGLALGASADGLDAGFYWVVGAADEASRIGLSRAIRGLVRVPDEGPPEAIFGADQGRAFIGVWGRPGPGAQELSVGISGDGDQAHLVHDLLVEKLTILNYSATVELVAPAAPGDDLRGLAQQRGFDVVVALGDEVRVVADRGAFSASAVGSSHSLFTPSLMEHALHLSNRDERAIVESTLGFVLARGTHLPIASWLVERSADRGATLAKSEMVLRWRLSELYALSGHPHLAKETISWLGSGSAAAQADQVRYGARLSHIGLIDQSVDADAALAAYAAAADAYEAIGFAPGSADSWRQQAELLVAIGRDAEALAAHQRSAEEFAASSAPTHAGHAELAAAELQLTLGGADPDAREAARMALARSIVQFESGLDRAGLAEAQAWFGGVAASEEDAGRALEKATSSERGGSGVEAIVVLAEANREALAGQRPQARASWLDAAERGARDGRDAVVVVALADLAADLALDPTAPGSRGKAQAALEAAAAANPSSPAATTSIENQSADLCGLIGATPGTNPAPTSTKATEVCLALAASSPSSEQAAVAAGGMLSVASVRDLGLGIETYERLAGAVGVDGAAVMARALIAGALRVGTSAEWERLVAALEQTAPAATYGTAEIRLGMDSLHGDDESKAVDLLRDGLSLSDHDPTLVAGATVLASHLSNNGETLSALGVLESTMARVQTATLKASLGAEVARLKAVLASESAADASPPSKKTKKKKKKP